MAVDEPGRIDILGQSVDDGHVVLTISDHLDWTDTLSHQLTLQEKINTYLAFVESGEILEHYADAGEREVEIAVVFLHEPDAGGLAFLNRASAALHEAGFQFTYSVLPLASTE